MNDDISTQITQRFKNVQRQKVTSGKRSETVHVSHLTIPCMRKTWYDLNGPKLQLDDTSICNFFLGTILHENCSLGGRNEVPVSANIRTMQSVKPENIDVSNFYDCVTGTIDDIIELDDGQTILVDKKTCKQIPEEPSEDYKMQIYIYKLLLYINEGIDVKKGAILYLDKPSSFFESRCFVFDLLSIEEIRNIVLAKLDQIKSETPPERVITFRCDWCPHLKQCDPYQNNQQI